MEGKHQTAVTIEGLRLMKDPQNTLQKFMVWKLFFLGQLLILWDYFGRLKGKTKQERNFAPSTWTKLQSSSNTSGMFVLKAARIRFGYWAEESRYCTVHIKLTVSPRKWRRWSSRRWPVIGWRSTKWNCVLTRSSCRWLCCHPDSASMMWRVQDVRQKFSLNNVCQFWCLCLCTRNVFTHWGTWIYETEINTSSCTVLVL